MNQNKIAYFVAGEDSRKVQDDAKIVDEIEKTIQKLLNLNIIESLSEDDVNEGQAKMSSTASDENNSAENHKR